MNKTNYLSGIFAALLCLLVGLYQGLLQIQFHTQLIFRESYLSWVTVSSVMYVVLLLILLKYYRYKKYLFASGTLCIVIIAFISAFIAGYIFFTDRRMIGVYQVTQMLFIATLLLHFISLIFSGTKQRKWLLIAGIAGACVMLIWIINLVTLDRTNFVSLARWVELGGWTSLAEQLVLVFFILNFTSEIRSLAAQQPVKKIQPREKYALSITAISIILTVIILGINLADKKNIAAIHLPKVNEGDSAAAHFFEARYYVNRSGDTMRYRFMKPLDYDPQKKYPIIVCLHHGGGIGTDNIRQVAASPVARLMEVYDNRKKYPAFLFVPQCPPGNSWGNVPGQPDMDALLFETMASIEKEFSIDSNRRYVTGESLGGYGVWHVLCARPDMFAAGIAVSGGGDPRLAKNIINVPIWAFHGAKDKNVSVQFDRDMIQAIRKAGGHPKYTEYPERAHDPWTEAVHEPGLFDWFFSQKKH